jgi:hypothetical protein
MRNMEYLPLMSNGTASLAVTGKAVLHNEHSFVDIVKKKKEIKI